MRYQALTLSISLQQLRRDIVEGSFHEKRQSNFRFSLMLLIDTIIIRQKYAIECALVHLTLCSFSCHTIIVKNVLWADSSSLL